MEISEVILVGRIEHTGLHGGGECGKSLDVYEPAEQIGVVRALNVCRLDVQRRRAADIVQHGHHRGQLVAFGQAGRAECRQGPVEARERREWHEQPKGVGDLRAEGCATPPVVNVRDVAARALERSPGGPEQAEVARRGFEIAREGMMFPL